jgi:hypothetical protein
MPIVNAYKESLLYFANQVESGQEKKVMTEGRKYDTGKEPVVRGLFHYFPNSLQEVAKASRYGKEKYDTEYEEKNWSNLEDAQGRYLDGAGRHLLKMETEGDFDKECQELQDMDIYHAAQVAWNMLSLLGAAH